MIYNNRVIGKKGKSVITSQRLGSDQKSLSEVGFEPTPAYADQNSLPLPAGRLALSLAP